MRFFLLDMITDLTPGKEAKGVKCISLTEQVLHDHFPDHPIYPGALIIEGLAQVAGFLLEMTLNTDESKMPRRALLAQVDKMKFYQTSGPGDKLIYTAKIDSIINNSGMLTVEASCEGEKRVSGRLMFMMMEVPSKKLSEQRVDLYKIWTRNMKECLNLR